ncbi:hypothetical protein J7T55_010954 [Diaporthe amygdali]|uniref:uncharacterized protein n=1 Tax=Phomopsis amygdali TaxID=1214568 RepID=UPI0022FE1523|nr:uncharacterized protein J7T55_010954 [Diaporthe amygdali]KAJ0103937.1 hypothetical protein J7T55_010954 [Diaporthe amygdali]
MDEDKITPVYAFDDTALNRVMPVCQVLRFPDIMDPEVLRTSLKSLLEIGNWKKLRGRWRLDTEIWPVLIPPEWPQSMSDLADPKSDLPILGLHVISFSNATVVALNYSHVLMDGGGANAFMKAWTNVVNGRQADVAPLAGAWSDPLDLIRQEIEQNGTEKFVLQDRVIDMGDFLPDDKDAKVQDPLWDMSSPESRWRIICLTSRAADAILKQARDSLPSDSFATEDDMIAGWIAKTVAGFLPASRPVNLMRVYDLRRALAKAGLLEPEAAYVQNMYQMAWTLTPEAKFLADAPLGKIAVGLRSTLSEQTTIGQIRATIKARLDSGMTPLYGDPKGMVFTANSRVKNHNCRKMDFSGAVKSACGVDKNGDMADEDKLAQAGTPDYIETLVQLPGPPPGPNFIQGAIDRNGNRTICTFLSNTMWLKMEEALKELDQLV